MSCWSSVRFYFLTSLCKIMWKILGSRNLIMMTYIQSKKLIHWNLIFDVVVYSHLYKLIWNNLVPMKISVFAWRLLFNCLPTKDSSYWRGMQNLASFSCVGGCTTNEIWFDYLIVRFLKNNGWMFYQWNTKPLRCQTGFICIVSLSFPTFVSKKKVFRVVWFGDTVVLMLFL